MVCIDGHIADALHRLAGDEMAQTGCCHGMAQDISRARQSLIPRKQALWNDLIWPIGLFSTRFLL
jgi:hypothetical protein